MFRRSSSRNTKSSRRRRNNTPVDTATALIQATGIEKSFGTLKVLKGIDFSASDREVVSIVGASGAGKSTLLSILGSLSRPDAGRVLINGTDIFSLGEKPLAAFRNREIGFVFQFHHLLPEFTAMENVLLPAMIGGKCDAAVKERARTLFEDLGVAARMTHKPSEMSGGEQQRVAVARALINSPAVLLADEPSGNLDSVTRAELHKMFFTLRDKYGITIVIVTHDKDLAAMSDRTLEMRDGLFV